MESLKKTEKEAVGVHAPHGAGVEVDIGVENQIIEVDIEAYGRENRPPPHADRYRIKIDHGHYVVEKRMITGRELLAIAGKNPPEKYELEKRMHGGDYVPVELDETVDLGQPGIEVFETFPLDETEG